MVETPELKWEINPLPLARTQSKRGDRTLNREET